MSQKQWYSVTIKGGHAGVCRAIKLSDFKPCPRPIVPCIIDGHMHIQSGACAPLPLLYNQLVAKIKFNPRNTPGLRSRKWIDGIGKVILGDGGRLQVLDSVKIAGRSISDNSETYLNLKNSYDFGFDQSRLIASANKKYKENDYVFCPMFVMPMDMEYAHIAGYDGQPIYHEENGEVFYYHRKSGIEAEELGEKVNLSHEIEKKKKALKLKKWYRQYEEHKRAAINHPMRLIPLYHYEPRRWRNNSLADTDTNGHNYGGWEFPFDQIATEKNAGIFAGYKMYTALGYRPLDDKLPNMVKFYEKCRAEKIPILNHCSTGGLLTHEQPFYKAYIEQGIVYHARKKEDNRSMAPDATGVSMPPPRSTNTYIQAPQRESDKDTHRKANEWFSENFVHPRAWRAVLDRFPDLFLCLAHFGGDAWEYGPQKSDWIQELIDMILEKDGAGNPKYPNLYTDISCFNIEKNMTNFIAVMKKNETLWDRVMFGTDWYMTLIVSPGGQKKYNEFCVKMKQSLDEIDDSFWIRATFLNPVRFYGFDKRAKCNKMYDELKDRLLKTGTGTKSLAQNHKQFLRALDELKTIKQSL